MKQSLGVCFNFPPENEGEETFTYAVTVIIDTEDEDNPVVIKDGAGLQLYPASQ